MLRRRKGWKPTAPKAPVANTAASMISHADNLDWLEGWNMFLADQPAPEDLRSQGYYAALRSSTEDGPFTEAQKAQAAYWLSQVLPTLKSQG